MNGEAAERWSAATASNQANLWRGQMAEFSYTQVCRLLNYDPLSGALTWRHRSVEDFDGPAVNPERRAKSWNMRLALKPAFTHINRHGYYCGQIFATQLLAHRVVWLLHYGKWPDGQIDHVNHVRLDNRIENLRCVTNRTNSQNQKLRRTNSSGVTGVYWIARDRSWKASISDSGALIQLGYFSTFEAAVMARKAAEASLGYHQNHGTVLKMPRRN